MANKKDELTMSKTLFFLLIAVTLLGGLTVGYVAGATQTTILITDMVSAVFEGSTVNLDFNESAMVDAICDRSGEC